MRYLIARHIRILASCLADYRNTWDIIPDILRLAQENPLQNTFNIKSLAQLKRVQQLLGTVEKDIERAGNEDLQIQRPERPVPTDKDVLKLFATGDSLLKMVAGLKDEKEPTVPKDSLLPIIQSLKESVTTIGEAVDKEKKELEVTDHETINEIAQEMRVYPSKIVAYIQSKRKKAADGP